MFRGRSRKIERRGSRCTQSVPSRTCPPPPGHFLHFLFSEVAFSAFSGKKSAQNLINYIKFLTAIINSYQSRSNSNDPLNILHECCDTNLLMISFNYMSTKRGGPDPLDPTPPPGSAPDVGEHSPSTPSDSCHQYLLWHNNNSCCRFAGLGK